MKPDNWQDALRSLLPDDYTPETEPQKPEARKKPKLTVSLDCKRAGKTATIISGFDPQDSEAAQEASTLAAALKRHLACGGSARGGEILVQGDRRDAVAEYLRGAGYKVRL